MAADAVQALSMDDFGDELDGSPSSLRQFEDNEENKPPKRGFMKPLFMQGGSSRPVTAGSMLSELEEFSLDHAAITSPQNKAFGRPTSPRASNPTGKGLQYATPPWSPASTAGLNIPSLDEVQSPREISSRAGPVQVLDLDAALIGRGAEGPLTEGNESLSPSSLEKQKNGGCVVQ